MINPVMVNNFKYNRNMVNLIKVYVNKKHSKIVEQITAFYFDQLNFTVNSWQPQLPVFHRLKYSTIHEKPK